MLKGHAKIELTNVNTGETEVHEHDNLVTNAVAKLINSHYSANGYHNAAEYLLPIGNKLTNGLLLFSKTLEESADNTLLPCESATDLVGYASNDAYSGEDTCRGSMNLVETEELENGYKYVWDFTTSQGNGIIASLGLTSYRCGIIPYHMYTNNLNYYSTNTVASNAVNYFLNALDFNFDTYSFTSLYLETEKILIVSKVQLHINCFGLKDTLQNLTVLESKSINLTSDTITLNKASVFIDGEDGYYYVVYSSGKNMTIARLDKATFELDEDYGQKTITLSKSTNIYTHNSNKYAKYNAVIMNGYLYIPQSGAVTKVNLNDIADMQTLENDLLTVGNATRYNKKNAIIFPRAVLFEDLTIFPYYKETTNSGIIINTERALFFKDDGTCFVASYNSGTEVKTYLINTFNYLATINNLATPVTKTAAQTMKITYTLTEVEE